MKIYKKSECKYEDGYITCKGRIVQVDNEIVDLINKLEDDVQLAKHNRLCESLTSAVPPLPKFGRKTEFGQIYPMVVADTPELDDAVGKAERIMDEIDEMARADKANEYFAGIKPLFLFVNTKTIVSCDQDVQHRFDLPTVGNPLELDKDKLSDLVTGMFM